jgi:hypothetical protein
MTRVPIRSNIEIWASAADRLFVLELFDVARAPLRILAINIY